MKKERTCNTCWHVEFRYPQFMKYVPVYIKQRGLHKRKRVCRWPKSKRHRQVVDGKPACEHYCYNRFNSEENDRFGNPREQKETATQISSPNQGMTHKAWMLPKKEKLSMAQFMEKMKDTEG